MKTDNESVTFFDSTGRFQFTVKLEFTRKVCSRPTEYDNYDLITLFKINRYLHNTSGPAIIDTVTKNISWWLNGNKLSKEDAERMVHNSKFHDVLINDVLGE
jgi:hypothetical protein